VHSTLFQRRRLSCEHSRRIIFWLLWIVAFIHRRPRSAISLPLCRPPISNTFIFDHNMPTMTRSTRRCKRNETDHESATESVPSKIRRLAPEEITSPDTWTELVELVHREHEAQNDAPNPTPSGPGAANNLPHDPDFYMEDGNCIVCVQDTLFKVASISRTFV
jgi:hypothetical protein